MAEKPIIDIQVNTAEFQRFLDLYAGYTKELDDQPKKWEAVNEAMGGATDTVTKGFESGGESIALANAHAEALSSSIAGAAKAQTSFGQSISLSERQFNSLAKTAARTAQGVTKAFSGAVSGSIGEMSTGFAGMAEGATAALGPVAVAVAAIAATIGGAAIGVKALADAAVTRQRSAFSLGVKPGLQSSFDINAQQFMAPSALAAAANAQLSYSSAGAISTLGIGFDAARKMSPSDLAYSMLRSATQAAQASPGVPLENIPAVMQYMSLGGQIGDVRNAMQLGIPALNDAQKATNANAHLYDLQRKAVSDSAALTKAVSGAGVRVQSVAINHLSGADPTIAAGLNALAGDHPGVAVAAAFHNVSNAIGAHVQPALHALQNAAQHAAGALQSVWTSLNTPIGGAASAATSVARRRGMYATSGANYAKSTAAIIAVAKAKGVNPMLALADALQESNLNPNLHYMDHYADGSDAGYSAGLFSLNQNGEGAGMSLRDMLDPRKNSQVALSEFARVQSQSQKQRTRAFLRAAGSDPTASNMSRASLIALSQTPGAIAALAERPAHEIEYAQLVNAIYQALMKANAVSQRRNPVSKPTQVSVHNSTPARVAVSANAASQF